VKIDFVSDVSCPWCAVGLSALEQALARLGDGVAVDLHFQPFELNPQMAAGGEDVVLHLTRKYGISAEQVAANAEGLRQRGLAAGFEFGVGKRRRIYNTFDAHRLLHWAGVEGPAGSQRALKHALFKAYFTDGLDPSDPALLQRLAGEVGLDGTEAKRLLAGDRYAAEVREAERYYQRAGIHAVPAVIIDERHLIEGGQPSEVFEQALRQIAAAA
jgi:predicted DsbA family dithiol-disulfide isomerase